MPSCATWMCGVTDLTTAAVPMQTGGHVFERILDTDAPLLTLETRQPEDLVEQFRQHVRHSGQAVYLWREGEGLYSLRETGLRVPGCLRLVDTLRYVLKSRHFGIYLIAGLSPRLTQTDSILLRRLAHTRTDFVRRVVVLDADAELTRRLGKMAVPLKHEQTSRMHLRLRDGRWVE